MLLWLEITRACMLSLVLLAHANSATKGSQAVCCFSARNLKCLAGEYNAEGGRSKEHTPSLPAAATLPDANDKN